ncbi:MAG: hypothetical protein QMD82_00225 [bacterium]|nr:hypothetical protein [bacterium]
MKKFISILLIFVSVPALLKATFFDLTLSSTLIELDPVMTAQGFSGITLFESTVSTYGNLALLAVRGTSITYINEQCKIPVDCIYSFVSAIPRQPQWLPGLATDMRVCVLIIMNTP